MTTLIRNVLLPVAILAAGVAVAAGLRMSKEPPQKRAQAVSVPTVEVVPVGAAPPGGFGIRVNGTVVPKREVTVSAEVEGRVVAKSPETWAGRAVREGQVLMELDPRPLEYQEATLAAELAQIEADLEQLKIEARNTDELLALAEEDLELKQRQRYRVGTLTAQSVSSASERDTAESQVLMARQSLQQLRNDQRLIGTRRAKMEAQKRRVQAQLDQVLYDLERATVASPVDGRIVEVLVEEDAYARPGEPLVRIEDTSAMEVRCSLRLEDLYWLAGGRDPLAVDGPYAIPHAPAEVTRELAGETASWGGTLARAEGTGIDERTRTIPCRVEVPDPDGLRRGMFVSVTLFAEEPRVDLLSIPRVGFRPNDTVWLVRDGRLSIRHIEPVRVLEDSVLVRNDGPGDPIEPGTPLVVSPLESPAEGMAVEAREAEPGGSVAAAALSTPAGRPG